MFYIGQKVVCIKDNFPLILYEIALNIPRAGRVYTVCDKRICTHVITKRRELGIQLCELRNPAFGTKAEPWFSGWRFRPWLDENSEEGCVEMTEPLVVRQMSCKGGVSGSRRDVSFDG